MESPPSQQEGEDHWESSDACIDSANARHGVEFVSSLYLSRLEEEQQELAEEGEGDEINSNSNSNNSDDDNREENENNKKKKNNSGLLFNGVLFVPDHLENNNNKKKKMQMMMKKKNRKKGESIVTGNPRWALERVVAMPATTNASLWLADVNRCVLRLSHSFARSDLSRLGSTISHRSIAVVPLVGADQQKNQQPKEKENQKEKEKEEGEEDFGLYEYLVLRESIPAPKSERVKSFFSSLPASISATTTTTTTTTSSAETKEIVRRVSLLDENVEVKNKKKKTTTTTTMKVTEQHLEQQEQEGEEEQLDHHHEGNEQQNRKEREEKERKVFENIRLSLSSPAALWMSPKNCNDRPVHMARNWLSTRAVVTTAPFYSFLGGVAVNVDQLALKRQQFQQQRQKLQQQEKEKHLEAQNRTKEGEEKERRRKSENGKEEDDDRFPVDDFLKTDLVSSSSSSSSASASLAVSTIKEVLQNSQQEQENQLEEDERISTRSKKSKPSSSLEQLNLHDRIQHHFDKQFEKDTQKKEEAKSRVMQKLAASPEYAAVFDLLADRDISESNKNLNHRHHDIDPNDLDRRDGSLSKFLHHHQQQQQQKQKEQESKKDLEKKKDDNQKQQQQQNEGEEDGDENNNNIVVIDADQGKLVFDFIGSEQMLHNPLQLQSHENHLVEKFFTKAVSKLVLEPLHSVFQLVTSQISASPSGRDNTELFSASHAIVGNNLIPEVLRAPKTSGISNIFGIKQPWIVDLYLNNTKESPHHVTREIDHFASGRCEVTFAESPAWTWFVAWKNRSVSQFAEGYRVPEPASAGQVSPSPRIRRNLFSPSRQEEKTASEKAVEKQRDFENSNNNQQGEGGAEDSPTKEMKRLQQDSHSLLEQIHHQQEQQGQPSLFTNPSSSSSSSPQQNDNNNNNNNNIFSPQPNVPVAAIPAPNTTNTTSTSTGAARNLDSEFRNSSVVPPVSLQQQQQQQQQEEEVRGGSTSGTSVVDGSRQPSLAAGSDQLHHTPGGSRMTASARRHFDNQFTTTTGDHQQEEQQQQQQGEQMNQEFQPAASQQQHPFLSPSVGLPYYQPQQYSTIKKQPFSSSSSVPLQRFHPAAPASLFANSVEAAKKPIHVADGHTVELGTSYLYRWNRKWHVEQENDDVRKLILLDQQQQQQQQEAQQEVVEGQEGRRQDDELVEIDQDEEKVPIFWDRVEARASCSLLYGIARKAEQEEDGDGNEVNFGGGGETNKKSGLDENFLFSPLDNRRSVVASRSHHHGVSDLDPNHPGFLSSAKRRATSTEKSAHRTYLAHNNAAALTGTASSYSRDGHMRFYSVLNTSASWIAEKVFSPHDTLRVRGGARWSLASDPSAVPALDELGYSDSGTSNMSRTDRFFLSAGSPYLQHVFKRDSSCIHQPQTAFVVEWETTRAMSALWAWIWTWVFSASGKPPPATAPIRTNLFIGGSATCHMLSGFDYLNAINHQMFPSSAAQQQQQGGESNTNNNNNRPVNRFASLFGQPLLVAPSVARAAESRARTRMFQHDRDSFSFKTNIRAVGEFVAGLSLSVPLSSGSDEYNEVSPDQPVIEADGQSSSRLEVSWWWTIFNVDTMRFPHTTKSIFSSSSSSSNQAADSFSRPTQRLGISLVL